MTTEISDFPTAEPEPSPPQPVSERWLDSVPQDWDEWAAFRHQATESRHARESLRDFMANHLDETRDGLKLGLGWLASGEPARALPFLQSSSDDLPKLLAGQALQQMNRHSEAAGLFAQLTGSTTVGAAARVALADTLFDLRDASALEKLAGQLTGATEKAFAVGLLAQLEGRREEAVAALQEAVDSDPDCAEATFRLASLLDLYGDDEGALELYGRFLSGELPHIGALMNLGVLHLDRENADWAVNCLALVVDADPQNERARRYLRDAYASRAQYYDESRERKADKQNAVLRIPVTDFELSVRARNCLQRMNIHSLGDLVCRTESELLSFKNFGETSLQEVKDILAMKGLRLGMSPGAELSAPAAPLAGASDASADGDALEINISDLDLSVRSRAALATLGITKVSDLTRTSETTLLSCKNFGQTSLEEIRSKLRNLGLDLTG